ncbi:MAG: hypothetical protein N4Q03_00505 [Candidatus Lightella neohaematopini]|nr:hypothetical protein [Candidatus Lightella neohaematopini]
MKLIYPEHLIKYIKYDKYLLYILVGNDYSLIQETKDYIKYYFYRKNFFIHNNLQIVCNNNFHNIINLFKTNDLFSHKQCFIIMINHVYENNLKREFILLCTKLVNIKLRIVLYCQDDYSNIINYSKYNLTNVLIVDCNIIPKNRLCNWLKFYSYNNHVILNKYCFKYLEKLYNFDLEFIINLIKVLKIAYPDNYNINIDDINVYLYKNNKDFYKLNKVINSLFTKKDMNIISVMKLLFNYQEEAGILIRIIQNKIVSIINNSQLYITKNNDNISYNLCYNYKKIKDIINIIYNMEIDTKYCGNKLFLINIIRLVILIYYN